MFTTVKKLGAAFIVSGIIGAVPLLSFAQEKAPAAAPADEGAQAHIADTGPRLDFPAGIVINGSTMYVANGRNQTLVKIDLGSHAISFVAGQLFKTGSNDGTGQAALFSNPDGMAQVGNDLYLCDTNNSIIRKISMTTGVVSTFAGSANIPGTDDGKGGVAHFNLPTQIAADPNGSRLFVTDTGSSTIRMILVADATVKTIGGQPQTEGKDDGPPQKSSFTRPRGIATDGKFVYVADTGNNTIRKIDLSSMTTSTIAGSGEEGDKNGAGTAAQFNNPGAMTTDGTFAYVMDADNHAIRKINVSTNEVATLTLVNGHIGSGCTVTRDGKQVYFSDTTENSVQAADTSNGNVAPVFPLQ